MKETPHDAAELSRLEGKYPTQNVRALFAMPPYWLRQTLDACRDVYHERVALNPYADDRVSVVREILALRDQFVRLSPRRRARLWIPPDREKAEESCVYPVDSAMK